MCGVVDLHRYSSGSALAGAQFVLSAILSTHPFQSGSTRAREQKEEGPEVVDSFSVVVFVCGLRSVSGAGGCVDVLHHRTWHHLG